MVQVCSFHPYIFVEMDVIDDRCIGSASYSESTLPSEIEVFGGGNMERGSSPPWLLSQLDKDFAPSIVPLPVEATAEGWFMHSVYTLTHPI